MNLILDIGNTQAKAAIFSDNTIIDLKVLPEINIIAVKKIIRHKKINGAIISTVTNQSEAIVKYLNHNFKTLLLNEKTKLPVRNLYKTPSTLGNDRLANASGAISLYPGKNILVIDAGTCIKYDFINSKKQYLGGAISPGVDMRFKALHEFTARLPLIKKANKKVRLTGQTTSDSILSGVQNGVFAEISETIRKYRIIFREVIIIFTGGDLPLLDSFISQKNRTFAAPHLTLLGLNAILNFNNARN